MRVKPFGLSPAISNCTLKLNPESDLPFPPGQHLRYRTEGLKRNALLRPYCCRVLTVQKVEEFEKEIHLGPFSDVETPGKSHSDDVYYATRGLAELGFVAGRQNLKLGNRLLIKLRGGDRAADTRSESPAWRLQRSQGRVGGYSLLYGIGGWRCRPALATVAEI